MARARNIKPGFFKNEELAELGAEAMLLFAGLWTLADREGRMEDRPKRIKAEVFPYWSNVDVNKLLESLASSGFIVRYEVHGSRCISIPNFTKHQNPHVKEAVSLIPAPCQHSARPVQDLEIPEQATLIPSSLIPSSLIPDSPNNAPVGALSIVRAKGKRSTEDIRKALGERLPWWEEFWRTFPCHESMNPAMDAFERTIQTVEVFQAVMDGARRYAAKARADPTMRLKYGQGWINDQRWTDENSVQLQTRSGQLNFVDQVSRQIEERLARGETPW